MFFKVGVCLNTIYGTGLNEYNLYGPCLVPKSNGFMYNDNTLTYEIPPFAFRDHPFMKERMEVSYQNPLFNRLDQLNNNI